MNRTKKFLCAMGFGVASWIAMGPAIAQEANPPEQTKQMPTTSMSKMQKKSMEATVVRVDTAKRHLVVKGDNGEQQTLSVPESVKRLDEIKPGDKLKVDYYTSLAISLNKSEGAPGAGEKMLTEGKGTKLPSGVIAHQESGTVEIAKIDKDKNQVTVKRPNGDMDTIDIKDPDLQSKLGTLKEGDKIQATYTEAAAISIERPNKDQNKGENMKPEEKSM